MSVTIDDLVSKRGKMERAIYKSIADEVEKFKQETGVSPKYISVCMAQIKPIGRPVEYILNRVDVEVDI